MPYWHPKSAAINHSFFKPFDWRFALCGSSARKLRRGGANLLAGRALTLSMESFSAAEFVMMAALKGSLEWTRRLVERGALVNRDGWTPLHYAASSPEPAVATYLLDRGARVDALSPRGTTALMLAARYGDERTVALLLERGADAKLRDPRGMSAADFARGGGREPLAQRLDQAASR